MTDFTVLYRQKLTTAEELAARVENGWRIGMDIALSQAPGFAAALVERAKREDIIGVKITTGLDIYPYEFYLDKGLSGKINGVSLFSGAAARKAVNGGYADIIPTHYRDMSKHVLEGDDYDVAAYTVSSMDKHGYFSIACSNSFSDALLEKAKRIYLEVNDQAPRAVCGAQIHISRVDAIIENSHPLPVIPETQVDEVSAVIGSLIAERIPDGACIQLGIGAIPDAVGAALASKRDLGIHTEMFTDSMVSLIECGAVNNSKKQINRYQSVTTFAFGSKRIYDFIDDNPSIALMPSSYVNNPEVICQNNNMMSVNTALEVDFWGQVCAESIGTVHISGPGGQVDYVRGALQSKGGKSFIALASTAKGGTISRIKPSLTPGSVVTTSKNDVDFIVTEYGVAHLRGESLASRTKQLIAIAHPDFRDELRFEAKKYGVIV